MTNFNNILSFNIFFTFHSQSNILQLYNIQRTFILYQNIAIDPTSNPVKPISLCCAEFPCEKRKNFLNHGVEKSSIDFVLGTFIYHIRKLSYSKQFHGGALCSDIHTQKNYSVNKMPCHPIAVCDRKRIAFRVGKL